MSSLVRDVHFEWKRQGLIHALTQKGGGLISHSSSASGTDVLDPGQHTALPGTGGPSKDRRRHVEDYPRSLQLLVQFRTRRAFPISKWKCTSVILAVLGVIKAARRSGCSMQISQDNQGRSRSSATFEHWHLFKSSCEMNFIL